jgi:hypothetical protein
MPHGRVAHCCRFRPTFGSMNRERAISAIESSIRRGSATPCTWASDRDAYIAQKSSELLDAVIEPVAVSVTGELFHYGVMESLQDKRVYAIAKSETNWLLYVPELEVFSLAIGETPTQLSILGFSTNDALAEWLG